jgi:hypothetical protein
MTHAHRTKSDRQHQKGRAVGKNQRPKYYDPMTLSADDMLGTLQSVTQFTTRFVDKGVEAVMPHLFILTEDDRHKTFVLALPDLAGIPNTHNAWQNYVSEIGEQFGSALGADGVAAAFWTSEVVFREPTTGEITGEAVVTYGMKRDGLTVGAIQNISRDPNRHVHLSSPYVNRPGRAWSHILAAFFEGISRASQAA